MTEPKKHHIAIYNDKEVVIDYVKDPKMEFHIACMRVQDNLPRGGVGFVVAPNGARYEITEGKRTVKLVLAAR